MSIDIDIESSRAVNERLPAIVNHIGDIKSDVQRLQSSIDAKVLSRSNLRSRLRNVQSNIESIQSDLLLLYRTTMQNINGYEENEARTHARVQNIPTNPGK